MPPRPPPPRQRPEPPCPLPPSLFPRFPVSPDQRGSQSSCDQVPPLPALSALLALLLSLWAAHWALLPRREQGGGKASERGTGARAPFVGTPLLEMEVAGLCAMRCPSPPWGLSGYCWPLCVQSCSLCSPPRPCNLRGSAETDRPWAPGRSPSYTVLPSWADGQDKWEQMACLRLRGLPAQPLPTKVSRAQASEPGLV